MRSTGVALLTASLAGCLGPPYQTPNVAVPPHFRETPLGVRESDGPPQQWWSAFGDPTLDEIVREAVSRDLDLQAAAARVREARALRGLTAARGKPQVDGVASVADTRDDGLFDVGFDARWEIDFFGGIGRDVDAAIAQVEATDEARRDVEVTLIAEVARNYVELRGAQRRVDVLDARIETLSGTLEIVRARQEGGLAYDLDVARSEALLDDTRAARPGFEFAVAAATHRLAVLTGREPGALRERLAGHAPIPVLDAGPTTGRPEELIARRPDVRRAERELAAAARIDVARADLYPRIALHGALGRRSEDVGGRYWSLGPALRWPLIMGGRVSSQIEVEGARRDQALAAFQQSVLGALEDVENALASYGRGQEERDRLASTVAAQRRAVELADIRYRSGLENFLAVLDAQRTLRDGEDRLAAAETRVGLSTVSLYKALGGG